MEGVKLIFCGQRSNSVLSKNRPLFPLLFFLFLRSMMPSASTNIYGFLANVDVENWQYNTLNISTSVFSLIASLVYSRYLVGKKLSYVILGTTVAACVTGILQIYFVTGLFEGITLFWVSIVLMDINAFASQVCPFSPPSQTACLHADAGHGCPILSCRLRILHVVDLLLSERSCGNSEWYLCMGWCLS